MYDCGGTGDAKMKGLLIVFTLTVVSGLAADIRSNELKKPLVIESQGSFFVGG